MTEEGNVIFKPIIEYLELLHFLLVIKNVSRDETMKMMTTYVCGKCDDSAQDDITAIKFNNNVFNVKTDFLNAITQFAINIRYYNNYKINDLNKLNHINQMLDLLKTFQQNPTEFTKSTEVLNAIDEKINTEIKKKISFNNNFTLGSSDYHDIISIVKNGVSCDDANLLNYLKIIADRLDTKLNNYEGDKFVFANLYGMNEISVAEEYFFDKYFTFLIGENTLKFNQIDNTNKNNVRIEINIQNIPNNSISSCTNCFAQISEIFPNFLSNYFNNYLMYVAGLSENKIQYKLNCYKDYMNDDLKFAQSMVKLVMSNNPTQTGGADDDMKCLIKLFEKVVEKDNVMISVESFRPIIELNYQILELLKKYVVEEPDDEDFHSEGLDDKKLKNLTEIFTYLLTENGNYYVQNRSFIQSILSLLKKSHDGYFIQTNIGSFMDPIDWLVNLFNTFKKECNAAVQNRDDHIRQEISKLFSLTNDLSIQNKKLNIQIVTQQINDLMTTKLVMEFFRTHHANLKNDFILFLKIKITENENITNINDNDTSDLLFEFLHIHDNLIPKLSIYGNIINKELEKCNRQKNACCNKLATFKTAFDVIIKNELMKNDFSSIEQICKIFESDYELMKKYNEYENEQFLLQLQTTLELKKKSTATYGNDGATDNSIIKLTDERVNFYHSKWAMDLSKKSQYKFNDYTKQFKKIDAAKCNLQSALFELMEYDFQLYDIILQLNFHDKHHISKLMTNLNENYLNMIQKMKQKDEINPSVARFILDKLQFRILVYENKITKTIVTKTESYDEWKMRHGELIEEEEEEEEFGARKYSRNEYSKTARNMRGGGEEEFREYIKILADCADSMFVAEESVIMEFGKKFKSDMSFDDILKTIITPTTLTEIKEDPDGFMLFFKYLKENSTDVEFKKGIEDIEKNIGMLKKPMKGGVITDDIDKKKQTNYTPSRNSFLTNSKKNYNLFNKKPQTLEKKTQEPSEKKYPMETIEKDMDTLDTNYSWNDDIAKVTTRDDSPTLLVKKKAKKINELTIDPGQKEEMSNLATALVKSNESTTQDQGKKLEQFTELCKLRKIFNGIGTGTDLIDKKIKELHFELLKLVNNRNNLNNGNFDKVKKELNDGKNIFVFSNVPNVPDVSDVPGVLEKY